MSAAKCRGSGVETTSAKAVRNLPQASAGTPFDRAVPGPDGVSRQVLRQRTFPARFCVLCPNAGASDFVQFNARIISAQAFVSGAAPGSFWDAAVVHCPLLFVGGRAQLPAIGGVVTEIIDNLPLDAALMLTARFRQKISETTRLSDDPQCYWQPRRRRPPSRGVLVCRRHLRFFRQVADTSPPRAEGNHPNPCLALRVRPLLMA
jgi:hypothetical protein